MEKMNSPLVHQVSAATFFGGASRAAFRVHTALRRDGVESLWLDAGGGAPPLPGIQRLAPPPAPPKPGKWQRRRERWFGPSAEKIREEEERRQLSDFYGVRTFASRSIGWGKAAVFEPLPAPDVYHLHWVANFLDWADALPALAARAPVVWTLHDLNPVRGTWHYDPFPEDATPARKEWDRVEMVRKAAALAKIPPGRLTFVAPSRWMKHSCEASELTRGFPVEHIPYTLDCEAFRPMPRSLARAALNLPEDMPVVGFVADSLDERRKGVGVLVEALGALRLSRRVCLLSAGSDGPAGVVDDWVHLGALRDDRLLRLFYSACDVFVCPSLDDNLPNTILEAMACGVAVAGSEVGGIVDMVRPGETGWLFAPGNAVSLRETLERALCEPALLREAGAAGRALIEREFSAGVVVGRHRALYRRLTEQR